MKICFKILFVVLLSLFFQSCEKELKYDCDINKYGTVLISNASGTPYNVLVDGEFKMQIPAKKNKQELNLAAGKSYQISAEQASGFTSTPIVCQNECDIAKCEEEHWQIP